MTNTSNSLRLLILEDQEADALLAVAQLRQAGLQVTYQRVQDEAEFRQALIEFQPQIVLSDFSLPDFDGLQALTISRDLAPHTPFIFLSGTIGEERAVEALRSGATDYVLKHSTARLAPAVRRALQDTERDSRHEAAQRRLKTNERKLRKLLRTMDYLGLQESNADPGESTETPATDSDPLPPDEEESLVEALRVALDEEQFAILYQPVVSVVHGGVESAEALLRWEHPDEGLLPPARFLPTLERSGLIVPTGQWVLEQVVRDMRELHARGIASLRIGVNISALQLRRPSFFKQFLSLLEQQPSQGFGLDVEVTESLFIQDARSIADHLHGLQKAGVRIALDDFGTGYSSLSLLPQLPLDILKIDRSFITGLPQDESSSTLVSSIMGLANAFRLTVVAEGVESDDQLAVLRTLRCPYAQGYLFGRPMFLDRLSSLLLSQRC